MTASEGIIASLAAGLAGWPIVFCPGEAIASWAAAPSGAATSASSPAHSPIMVVFRMLFAPSRLDFSTQKADALGVAAHTKASAIALSSVLDFEPHPSGHKVRIGAWNFTESYANRFVI